MPEEWLTFVQDKWWAIAAAVIALIIVVSIVKTVIKWVLVAAIIAAVVIYGANYTEQLKEIGDQVMEEAKDQAFRAFVGQGLQAKYESKADGTYAVYTDSVRVEGSEGSDEVTVIWKGITVGTFRIDATIEAFLEQAKKNAK